MSVGSYNNKLSSPPTVVPGISIDPPTPELTAESSTPSPVPPTLSMLNIRREEIRALWNRIKAEYDECTGCIAESGDSAADSLPILKAKYGYCCTRDVGPDTKPA